MTEQRNVVLDHNYDGIEEYDNPLPGWWTFIFVGSIAFSVVYVLYYHSNVPDRTIYDGYDRAVAANMRLQFGDMGILTIDRETIEKYMHDEKWLKFGKVVFKTNCVSCHGVNAQGVVGPNLTDNYWKHVKKLEDIGFVIRNGAAGKAMPSWKNRLHPNELVLVAAYVASLRGTNAPGKGPEGREIPPWPQPEASTDKPAAEDKTPADTDQPAEAETPETPATS